MLECFSYLVDHGKSNRLHGSAAEQNAKRRFTNDLIRMDQNRSQTEVRY